ncbi:MAG: hypothetical protein ACOCP8_04480 [archaeon]
MLDSSINKIKYISQKNNIPIDISRNNFESHYNDEIRKETINLKENIDKNRRFK